jgi:IS30 family transposase
MSTAGKKLSSAEKTQLWQRWKDGESLSEIAEALGRCHSTVASQVYRRGGIAPMQRRRGPQALRTEEREEISRRLCSGETQAVIARCLNRSRSTISRELARNGGAQAYRGVRAEQRAWDQAQRPKVCRLAEHSDLREWVAAKLQHKQWSPEQISASLKASFPGDERMRVSHETIYRSLFIQARGVLKKELTQHLRRAKSSRRARKAGGGNGQGQIIDAINIRERPAEANDRAVPGHWEGDLLIGSQSSQIATLVERHSRYVVLVKVPARDTKTVVKALTQKVLELPLHLRRSLTWDRGLELASHKDFTLATDVNVYFCDPRSPWQRGSNENTNGLLRQYFPKGSPLSGYTQAQLDEVALKLNGRPRETLGFKTPAEKFAGCVALTG